MALKLKQEPPVVVLFMILLLSLMMGLSWAASGGSMGGSSFSSGSSGSSYSSGSSSSSTYLFYGGGNGGSGGSGGSDGGGIIALYVIIGVTGGLVLFFFIVGVIFILCTRRSCLMVQVGLSGKAHTLQRDLNTIAKTTDTSSSKGWSHILTETTSALLRHPDYYISGYSSVVKEWNNEDLKKCFKKLTKEEREKFDIESLVNVDNIKIQRAVIPKAKEVGKDCIVVTILVAAKGGHKLPAIRSTENLNEALRYLSAISSSKLKGVEVLWSPQDENDSLSVEELLENYPLLRPI